MRITTADELFRTRGLGRCELVRGELVRMIPAGGEHGWIALNLAGEIRNHVKARGLGRVYAAETGFLLGRDPDTVRAPDVAFVRADRIADVHGPGFLSGAPDLAVEVLSPDDRPGYVREKVTEWLEAGARAVWVVDPRRRTVTVHESERQPVTVAETGTLRGGRVLRGFALPVREIFA